RILQDSCPAHDPTSRHGDRYIKLSEVVEKLSWSQVWARLPAPQVVVFRQSGKPLGRLKERAVKTLCHPVPHSVGSTRQFGMPVDLNLSLAASLDRFGEIDRSDGPFEPSHSRPWSLVSSQANLSKVDGFTAYIDLCDYHSLGLLRRRRQSSWHICSKDVVIQSQHDTVPIVLAVV